MNGLSPADLALLLAALAGAGIFAGLVAGLFGVGGGTVIVPVLFYAFGVLKVGGASDLHVAVGSSLLTIVVTSWRSLAAHRRHGAVDEAVLKTWTPWVGLGAVIGAAAAGLASMQGLGVIYALCLTLVAAQMGLWPADRAPWRDLPHGWGRRLTGALIGALSALMGVGGGSFGGMLMSLCGRPIHQAVATASGFGMAIGLAATAGFVVFGWDAPGRPPLSLGYVNLPAALLMGAMTALTAPLGARLAHRLDRRVLKRAFAAYLALTAAAVAIRAL
ncbi:sulfite exporter TauE/SafE family protein [Brevundimonas sp.]|uniref:sulfite exporter TauE/SafE family protein n=1 Tax=Brevundimonas sp. TaxID=1871086 RepID=UPI0025B7D0FB|nr:sulfite exporter TauE/SafE family protein [Brevundimonas sp.]